MKSIIITNFKDNKLVEKVARNCIIRDVLYPCDYTYMYKGPKTNKGKENFHKSLICSLIYSNNNTVFSLDNLCHFMSIIQQEAIHYSTNFTY